MGAVGPLLTTMEDQSELVKENGKYSFLQKRTRKEKLCCIFLITVVSILVLTLLGLGLQGKNPQWFGNIQGFECETKACKINEERIGYLLDNSTDPCEDFFQYACNSQKRGKEFPYAREEVTLNLTELVVTASGEFGFLKDFYQSCISISEQFPTIDVAKYCMMDDYCPKEELSRFGAIYQSFRENAQVFANLTAWPVLTENWESKSEDFTWQQLSEDILKHEYYLGAFQYVKDNNGFPTENFFSNVFFAPMIDHSVKQSLLIKRKKQYTSKIHIIPMTLPDFLRTGNNKTLEDYKKVMIIAMKILGAKNESLIEEDMMKVVENEKKIANLSKYEYFYDISDIKSGGCTEVTLDEMNKLFPTCEWIGFVNNVLQNPNVTVNGSEPVLIPGIERFQEIYKVIKGMTKREQANLLLWRIFAKFAVNFLKTGNVEDEMYKNIFDTEGTKTSRSENCVNQIKTFFPNIGDDLLISHYLKPEEKDNALHMFQEIKEEFSKIITTSKWMQKETQREALQKLKKMEINVGKLHNDVEHLPEALSQMKADDYLGNIRILGNSFWKKMVQNLRTPKDAFSGEGVDNAYYWPIFNQVQINVGLMKGAGIGYSKDLPRALMYGGFTACVLGHELTHGFDNRGSQYDENGEYRNWWDQKSKAEYEKKTRCMINQYNNFVFRVNGTNYTANGLYTLGENIADNGGIKIGYRAFLKASEAAREVIPPKLNLTAKQLFWVGHAQTHCLYTYERYSLFSDLLGAYKGGAHAPAPWRVNTVLSNQEEFAKDFNCPAGAKLNPAKRCIVW